MNFKEIGLVLKNIIWFNHIPRGKGMPNYKQFVRPVNTIAVKKYFVKIKKLDKSQTRKGGLGKKERLDELKSRKGGPCKS